MILEVSAPSNIALIKYMGKLEGGGNRPTNSSLSYTLEDLKTFIRVSEIDSGQDEWRPYFRQDLAEIKLAEKSVQKFLMHFAYLKQVLEIPGSYLLESANNFPSDCGLASSASSFAALTRAAHAIALEKKSISLAKPSEELAELSRKGSGSSSRSFFGPWALWSTEGLRPIEFDFVGLHHQVFIVESSKKKVSSSEAHQRVLTSELFSARPERAEKRLASLIAAFRCQDWRMAYEICWAEFFDMHALFETSIPPFGYMEPGTIQVLKTLRQLWDELGDGPLVTMDAGANVHALFRDNQKALAHSLQDKLRPLCPVLVSVGLRTR